MPSLIARHLLFDWRFPAIIMTLPAFHVPFLILRAYVGQNQQTKCSISFLFIRQRRLGISFILLLYGVNVTAQ